MNSLVLAKCCCVSQHQDTQRGNRLSFYSQSRNALEIILYRLKGVPTFPNFEKRSFYHFCQLGGPFLKHLVKTYDDDNGKLKGIIREG